MPAKRNRKNSGAANEGKETSRGRGLSSSAAQRDPFASIPDDRLYKFTKDEIVWAKMKFFSAWPAKVSIAILKRLRKVVKIQCLSKMIKEASNSNS
jgi:hypothetical protein